MSKKSKSSLGRALIKQRFSKVKTKLNEDNMLHTADLNDGYDWNRINLKSVTEESDFNEFINTAQAVDVEFQNEKMNTMFVNPLLNLDQEDKEMIRLQNENVDKLKIPRRPKWSKDMTKEELDKLENEEFLNWRRGLALLQDEKNLLFTPYEKNLEFWRQLWRVIERSDVIVQIVDARNPLLFRCEDLEKYVNEVSSEKINVILINKSDLLTGRQRQFWANYFREINLSALFFSALNDNDSQLDSEFNEKLSINVSDEIEPILNRDQLIHALKTIHSGKKVVEGVTTVGFTGYPNVGKSSTINSLLLAKKVSVSATPGKTKHFQTLYLDTDLLLCDCPGLVMPSFVTTKSEMILNGILPVDHMRNHVPPMNLLLTRIPRHVLEDHYGVMIPRPNSDDSGQMRPPNSAEFLNPYAFNRGFMTANGQPDNARAARIVLKDYINGKLLYAISPPNVDQNEYHTFPEQKKIRCLENRTKRQILASTGFDEDSVTFDKNYVKNRNFNVQMNLPFFTNSGEQREHKCWKQINKHKNKNKREKSRRTYAYLDEH